MEGQPTSRLAAVLRGGRRKSLAELLLQRAASPECATEGKEGDESGGSSSVTQRRWRWRCIRGRKKRRSWCHCVSGRKEGGCGVFENGRLLSDEHWMSATEGKKTQQKCRGKVTRVMGLDCFDHVVFLIIFVLFSFVHLPYSWSGKRELNSASGRKRATTCCPAKKPDQHHRNEGMKREQQEEGGG